MPKFFRPSENETDEFHPKIAEAGEVKTLIEWEAPSRPFRKKDRSYYTTVAIIVILLILIAFLASEFLLIGVILAFAFVAYALAFVPPGDMKYKISTQGITVGEHFYFWHELESFWFKVSEGQEVLFVQTKLRYPAQFMVILGSQDQEAVKKEVAQFLPFAEKPKMSIFDKWSEALQKHFPLENIK